MGTYQWCRYEKCFWYMPLCKCGSTGAATIGKVYMAAALYTAHSGIYPQELFCRKSATGSSAEIVYKSHAALLQRHRCAS